MATSIITVANQKGGVGKTTSVCNLAASYADTGKKVLVVDLDYQGNLTELLNISNDTAKKHSIARVISVEAELPELVLKTPINGIDIIPCTRELDELRDKISGEANQFHFLQLFFKHEELEKYDIVLIDTHPSQDLFFKAALVASHYYLIPLFPEHDSCQGLAHQISAANKVSKFLNPMLYLLGVFITKFDKNYKTHETHLELLQQASKATDFHLFNTIIPSSAAVPSASASHIPLNQYKAHLGVSTSYATLAGEILPLLKGKRTGRKPSPVKTDELLNYTPSESEYEIETVATL
ncbi:MAG: ParA family protein [Myxococcales bacterium]|nr:ParA family protein [Myxococcales bacterium]